MTDTRNKRRAAGKKVSGQISISIPEKLVSLIHQMAEAENRNRSNFIATVLERLADEKSIKSTPSGTSTRFAREA
jgi:metal-responsive CopG/Arc/MetJ family transcriptional regulator